MYEIATLGRKDNALEPENHIATWMSSALDLCPFDPKFNRKHLCPMGRPYA